MTPWLFLMTMMSHPGCEFVSGEQIFGAELFMPVVDAAQRRAFASLIQHMTNIVQQRGHDDRPGHTLLLSKKRALQRVLALRDPLSPVLPGAPRCEQP